MTALIVLGYLVALLAYGTLTYFAYELYREGYYSQAILMTVTIVAALIGTVAVIL